VIRNFFFDTLPGVTVTAPEDESLMETPEGGKKPASEVQAGELIMVGGGAYEVSEIEAPAEPEE